MCAARTPTVTDPGQRADLAVHALLRSLCGTMLHNEPGVVRRLDPEHLHDYRVACRRTRVALTNIKRVTPLETTRRFRRELRSLHRATGPMRDLDVFREELPGYRRGLPPEARARLDPLDVFLEAEQRREHAQLLTVLESAWYRQMIEDWKAYVLTLPEPGDGGERAGKPVGKVARRALRRGYRKVLETGDGLGPRSSARRVHRLRIACKKFRYLIEFFRGLYPDELVDRPVARLKRLQDVLGEHQDLDVHGHALHTFAVGMAARERAPPETLVAMGRLIEQLGERQRASRKRVEAEYRSFRKPKSRRRLERLVEHRSG